MLRAQLVGKRPRAAVRSGSPLRLVAAAGGGMLGVVALVFAAPALRGGQAMEPSRPTSPNSVSSSTTTAAKPQPTESLLTPTQGPKSVGGLADIDRAKEALAENRPADAVTAFEQAFSTSPELRSEHAAAYAEALAEDGKNRFDSDSEGAASRFAAAAAADPNSYDAHFFLAKVYTRRSDPVGAEHEYLEAIRINPKSADAQFNLGFVYFSQKRYEEALRQYEKVVELRPPYLADVFYNIAACYDQMKRKPDAITALRRGLQVVPDSDLLRQRLKQLGG